MSKVKGEPCECVTRGKNADADCLLFYPRTATKATLSWHRGYGSPSLTRESRKPEHPRDLYRNISAGTSANPGFHTGRTCRASPLVVLLSAKWLLRR